MKAQKRLPPQDPAPDRQPQRGKFIDPFNHDGWLDYFNRLLPRFQYIRFLGLPTAKEIPDVLIERLYVPLYLGESYSQAEAEEDGEKNVRTVEDILGQRRRLIFLGDPGAGKSTIVNYLTSLFAAQKNHSLAESLGNMIPLPFVLRDFTLGEEIDFAGLLDQFRDQPFWSRQLSSSDLQAVMASGQALFLLDGLDEIGDIEQRKALRRAILDQGMARYPRCLWLLTSRIVGYDDVPFDEQRWGKTIKMPPVMVKGLGIDYSRQDIDNYGKIPANLLDPLYVLPFNKKQIRTFVEKWYTLREADESLRRESIESLQAAIEASPSIERLAHRPFLLTMMALIHRNLARLPSGRVHLYDEITRAYLESIDEFRGLRDAAALPSTQHRLWLAALAFAMQQERVSGGKEGGDILVPESAVVEKITGIVGEGCDARQELGHIARRSGLLIPKKPGFYAFIHLSFQEYFAAVHLYEQLMGFGSRDRAVAQIGQFKGDPLWHETLVFLFEKLAAHRDASDHLFNTLFPGLSGAADSEDDPQALMLAVEVVGDLHSGLSPDLRGRAAGRLLRQDKYLLEESLLEKVNHMAPEIQAQYLTPALKGYLRDMAAHKHSPSPDLLLFLQYLTVLTPQQVETLLQESGLLPLIAPESLHFLSPLIVLDGPVKRELMDRLPLRSWLFGYYWSDAAPIFYLADRPLRWDKDTTSREDLLVWFCSLFILLDVMQLKIFLAVPVDSPDYKKALARARARALDRDLDLALARALDRALARALALAQALAQALDRALAQDRAQDRALDLALDLARAWAPPPRNALEIVAALFKGDDHFTGPEYPEEAAHPLPPGLWPLWNIYRGLADLVLGRGERGAADTWREIGRWVETIGADEWIHRHLPFVSAQEFREALSLLGLPLEGGKLLLEAEWFAPGHPLAPALDARPSQFSRTVEKIIEKTR